MTIDRSASDRFYTLTAKIGSSDQARSLIEELEDRGIPPNAIDLAESPVAMVRSSERRADLFGDVGRSVLAGAALGSVSGVVLGGLLALAAGLEFPATALLGVVFGAGIGGAAGGIRVVKYASPAWRESQHSEEPGVVTVTVRHPDSSVIDRAEEVIAQHEGVITVRRQGPA